MTPPGWAYPYATVWDDFDSPTVATMEGSLADSGQTWVKPTDGQVFGFGMTPYFIGNSQFVSDSRGINQSAEHPSVLGWDLNISKPPNPTDGTIDISQYVLVPGATSDNFFVKFEFYTPSENFGGGERTPAAVAYIDVLDGYTTDRWQRGYHTSVISGGSWDLFALPGGPFPGEFPPGSGDSVSPIIDLFEAPGTFTDSAYLDSWHTRELRVEQGAARLLIDGAEVWRGPGQVPSFQQVYVSVVASVGGFATDGLPDRSAYVDHFQAGPSLASPPVPILRAAPGPTSLLFEPQRINV